MKDLLPSLISTNSVEYIIHTIEIDEDIVVSVNQVIPIGLIINELVTNTIKHGLLENDINEIVIRGWFENGFYEIQYEDSGEGPSADMEPGSLDSLGMQLIVNLASQLKGRFLIIDTGAKRVQRLSFPEKDALKHFSRAF
ncbi:MAG: sensor histidine kinase [Spirochaetales bacterium]|uniref:histidine kinase n=1 Tax=Candidatus Thalassospirochaeta sargassi TaxID=3119039 RepID=A0AAJ1IG54_9SPIO|nr:sensor histidine kinase [Spirochaetales bacterium]